MTMIMIVIMMIIIIIIIINWRMKYVLSGSKRQTTDPDSNIMYRSNL